MDRAVRGDFGKSFWTKQPVLKSLQTASVSLSCGLLCSSAS